MSAQPEIKTALIRGITPNGTWTSGQGQLFYRWQIVLDDGMPGDILTKENTPPFVLNQEAKLEVHRKESNGNTYISFRKVREERPSGGGRSGGGGGGGMSKEREEQIARMSCLNNAISLMAHMPYPEATKVLYTADQLYAYVVTGTPKDVIFPQK